MFFFLTNQLKRLFNYAPGRLKATEDCQHVLSGPFRNKFLRFLETIFKRLFLFPPFQMAWLLLLD